MVAVLIVLKAKEWGGGSGPSHCPQVETPYLDLTQSLFGPFWRATRLSRLVLGSGAGLRPALYSAIGPSPCIDLAPRLRWS